MIRSISAALLLFASVPMARAAVAVNAPDNTPRFDTTDQRIAWYEGEVRTSPDSPRLSAGLITAWLQKVRETADPQYLELASKLVQRMLDKEGGDLIFVRLLNEIDLQRHDFKAVAARSKDLLRYNASDSAIWGNLGDAYMELGEYELAREAYFHMFELRPSLASYNRLGYWTFVTGDPQAAIVLMREAIDAGSDMSENVAWCWAELGDIYFKMGRLSEARASYESAIKLFPSLHRAYAGLAKVQASEGQLLAAIGNYQRAQSMVPMVEYSGALEDLFTMAGNSKEAAHQKQMPDVIARLGQSRNEKTNRNLAILLADHDRDLGAALNLIRAEIPDRPDVYTYDALAWVLFKSGRLAEAADASRRALRLGTPEPSFYFHAQAIAHARGDEATAVDCANRLASLNTKFDILRRSLTVALPSRVK